jgi:hypothetical protein
LGTEEGENVFEPKTSSRRDKIEGATYIAKDQIKGDAKWEKSLLKDLPK